MRIRITGEKTLIDSLQHELAADPSIKTEHPQNEADHTELAFALTEAATIIAAINGVAKLVEYLITVARHTKPDKTQVLQLKSALGIVTVHLSKDVTPQELTNLLQALEPQP